MGPFLNSPRYHLPQATTSLYSFHLKKKSINLHKGVLNAVRSNHRTPLTQPTTKVRYLVQVILFTVLRVEINK